ncbi:CHORD family protein [Aphelenchoides avenae]|nr:CHORD family protein [Aphelenchus avenae]
MSLVQCYNKGCGQKFDPEQNGKDACQYHPGPPYFHDAYKIWQCCDKKSTDFGTWLSYKGCTKGPHNPEKPAETGRIPANMQIRPEKQDEVIVWNGLNKPAERPADHVKREMKVLPKDTTETALRAIERQKELRAEAGASEGDLVVGAPCKNSGCKATYNGPESRLEPCAHHPGTAVFHEGMKYWSCCQRKTSNFSAFLEQEGCAKGDHNWSKNERVDKIREDWFSRTGHIHVNVYCKGALPDKCHFETDGLVLRAKVVHGFGTKESELNYELWGEIEPNASRVLIGERKVEMILKQAGPEGWPRLRYNHDQKDVEERENSSDA